MMTKTRYFVIASLLTLGIGLGVGTLAYFGDTTSASSRQGGPDDLKLLPVDAALVGFVDVRTVMTSSLRERLRTLLPFPADGQQEFATQTGIDIDTDIDQIVVGFSPVPTNADNGGALVLARGRFDTVRIEALMREHGAQVEAYKGKRLVTGEGERHQGASVAFLEPGFIAIGSSRLVRGAVDQAESGAGVTGNDAVMNLVRDLDTADAWVVGRFDALAAQAQMPQGVRDRLPAIQWFSAMATVDSGVRGMLKVEAQTDEAAASVREVIQGIMALGRLQAGSHPEVEGLLQSLQLGGTGKTVALGFDLPPAFFETLGRLAPTRPSATNPAQ